jgi:uncharacterized protein
MLGRLARVMRAAGEDVALAAPGARDEALLALAEHEGRVLLTRDRALAARAGERGRLIVADQAMAQAEEVARATGAAVDWRGARFTRCLMDNTELRAASPAEIAAMPATARQGAGPFRACALCRRVYWPGSHVGRLEERLDRLAIVAETEGYTSFRTRGGGGSLGT